MEKPSLSSEHLQFSSHPINGNSKPIKAKNISVLVLVTSLPILYASLRHIPPSTLFKDTIFWFLMSNSIIMFIAIDIGALFAPSQDIHEKKLYEDFVANTKLQNVYFMEEPTNTIDKSLVVKERQRDDITIDKSLVVIEKQRDDNTFGKSLVVIEDKPSSSCLEESRAKDAHQSEVKMDEEFDKALVVVKNGNRKKVKKANSLDPNVLKERSLVATEKPLRQSRTQDKRRSYNKSECHDYEKLSNEELNRRVEEFIRRSYMEMRLQLINESV